MEYPTLNRIYGQQQRVDAFLGYNHNMRIGSGEFYDMENLTSDNFPVMSTRKMRTVEIESEYPVTGMISKDALCYTAGSKFYINERGIEMDLNAEPKQLVSMGAYVIILPDRKYINTIAPDTDRGSIDNEVTTTGELEISLCTLDGMPQGITYRSATEPDNPEDGMVWLDTGSTPNTLKKWSKSSGMWVAIATTYVKLSAPGINAGFKEYDGINISGLDASENPQLQALNGSAIVWGAGEGYIIIVGIISETFTFDQPVTISRKMPEMDFVIESGNRLWGCRYGLDADGNVVNEIYASKLGDFKNWRCYMGISTDSYAVSIGSDGEFTGAITHGGYPLFFKRNALHKIYGQIPANFQVQTIACRGVQKGSNKSLAIVNEILYYLSDYGVCAYDGSLPVEVSSQFGDIRYHDGVAAGKGSKYYVRLSEESDHRCIFVYDTANRMWHREDDDLGITELCGHKGAMMATDGSRIYDMTDGSGQKIPFRWSATTGIIGDSKVDASFVTKINLRMALEKGSKMRILAQYDSIGGWHELCSLRGNRLRAFDIPVKNQRCDHLRLKLEGTGGATVFAMTTTIESSNIGGKQDGLMLDF